MQSVVFEHIKNFNNNNNNISVYKHTHIHIHISPSFAAQSRVSVQRPSSLTPSVYYDESMDSFRATPVIRSSPGQN